MLLKATVTSDTLGLLTQNELIIDANAAGLSAALVYKDSQNTDRANTVVYVTRSVLTGASWGQSDQRQENQH